MRQFGMAAAAAGLWVLTTSGLAGGQQIIAGNAAGSAGQETWVSVRLATGGAQVAGTQNDIGHQLQARIAAKADGKPDCTVNPEIAKANTSFAFRPSGCSGDACTGIRALVLSTNNVNPIPDGSVLYTCRVKVAADALVGDYPLAATSIILSDPNGNAIAGASGQDGKVTICDASPVCDPPAVRVATCPGAPGSELQVPVTLLTGSIQVAGTQNDINFSPQARIVAKASGKPDCTVNPYINKGATSFAFQPSGCSGDACTGIRALVLSTDNVAPIPDNSVLYSCRVILAGDAYGTVPFTVSGVILVDPSGSAIAGAHGCEGGVNTQSAMCGNGVVESGEDCDDAGICMGGNNAGTPCTSDVQCIGQGMCDALGIPGGGLRKACNSDADCGGTHCVRCMPFGGDGCAANCTIETAISGALKPGALDGTGIQPGTSGEIINADILTIPLPLSGAYNFRAGKPRSGRIPVVQKPWDLQLPRIPVSTLACACVRGVEYRTCGGTQYEADGGTPSTDCTFDPSVCAGKKPCVSVAGPGNAGAGTVGCNGLPSVSYTVVQDAIKAPPATENLAVFTYTGGGPAGSMLLLNASQIGTAVGACTGTGGAYGADGQFCTDDDPAVSRGTAEIQTLTTGMAQAEVLSANDIEANDVGPFQSAGVPVSCTALAMGNLFDGTTLASAQTLLNQATTGDVVVANSFVFAGVPPPPPCSPPSVEAGSVGAGAGTTVDVPVTLHTGADQVAGVQIDIGFQPQARVAAQGNGKPDCTVNPNINKGATSFAFRPSGCSGDACTGIRALVLSTDNVNAIPDGSVLYTCKVTVAPDAIGTYPIAVTGVILSNPEGNAIAGAHGCNGAVIAEAACAPPAVDVATVQAAAGSTVGVSTRIGTGGLAIAGAQVDIMFDQRARIAMLGDGRPNCAVNPDIDKWATSFAFIPGVCGGPGCAGIRAVVVSLDNTNPIPDGAVLFTCVVQVAPNAVGTVPLTTSRVVLGDPYGNAIVGAHGCDGAVIVDGPLAELRVGNATVGPAQLGAAIPISLTNGTTVRGVQVTITDVPDAVSLNQSLHCSTTARASALLCDANQVGNEIRVVMLSTGYGGIAPGSGQIATVYVDDSSPTCSTGASSVLGLSRTAIADASGNPVPHVAHNGALECACKGNLDGNAVTDVFDALLCVDFSIGKKYPSTEQRTAADVRCDDVIDIFDCLGIVDVILGRLPVCPPCVGGAAASGDEVTLRIVDGSTTAGTTAHVTVALDNATAETRGVQFSLPITNGAIRLAGVSTTERSQGLIADAHQEADGTIHVLVMSVDETTIAAGSGPVLELALTVDANASGSLSLTPTEARAVGEAGPLATNASAGSLAVQTSGHAGSGCALAEGPVVQNLSALALTIPVLLRPLFRRRRRHAW